MITGNCRQVCLSLFAISTNRILTECNANFTYNHTSKKKLQQACRLKINIKRTSAYYKYLFSIINPTDVTHSIYKAFDRTVGLSCLRREKRDSNFVSISI